MHPTPTTPLNHHSPVPLYHQLAQHLRRRITAGELSTGTRIPSENHLAAQFTVGRPTVRQATELLVREGWLRRRRGSGTYVQPAPEPLDLLSVTGTLSALTDRGLATTTTLLATPTVQSIKSDANTTSPFAGQTVLALDRLTQVDGAPVLLEEIQINASHFAGIETMDLAGESISRTLERHWGSWPVRARQRFRIAPLDARRSEPLELQPGSPLLMVERTLDFPAPAPATGTVAGVFATLYCRTDTFDFSQTLVPPAPPTPPEGL